MQDIQELLNALTIALILAFTTLMLLDLFADLVNLWTQLDKKKIQAVNSLPQKPEIEQATSLPYLKKTNKFVPINTPTTNSLASTKANSVDIESLVLLIQKLPQSRIRTAARRLGIADKVDGKYQKLGVLRTQLKAKLKSQPIEAVQVLKGIEAQLLKSSRGNTLQ
ncbi:MAG: hypothetical protein QNJ47_05620 [Nostocaceae cyanobacterium]|nr:hypothetical protein [Nostocaceae cyanobacterium]